MNEEARLERKQKEEELLRKIDEAIKIFEKIMTKIDEIVGDEN